MTAGSATSPYTTADFSSITLAPHNGRHDFHVRANSTDLLRQVFSTSRSDCVMDDSIRPQTIRMDADDLTLAGPLNWR